MGRCEPVEGDTVEERTAFECARQGIPVGLPAAQMEKLGRALAAIKPRLDQEQEAS